MSNKKYHVAIMKLKIDGHVGMVKWVFRWSCDLSPLGGACSTGAEPEEESKVQYTNYMAEGHSEGNVW